MTLQGSAVSVVTSIGGPPGSSTHRAISITTKSGDGQLVELSVNLALRNRFATTQAADMLRRAAAELDAIADRPWPTRKTVTVAKSGKRRGPGRPRKDEAAKASPTSAKRKTKR